MTYPVPIRSNIPRASVRDQSTTSSSSHVDFRAHVSIWATSSQSPLASSPPEWDEAPRSRHACISEGSGPVNAWREPSLFEWVTSGGNRYCPAWPGFVCLCAFFCVLLSPWVWRWRRCEECELHRTPSLALQSSKLQSEWWFLLGEEWVSSGASSSSRKRHGWIKAWTLPSLFCCLALATTPPKAKAAKVLDRRARESQTWAPQAFASNHTLMPPALFPLKKPLLQVLLLFVLLF